MTVAELTEMTVEVICYGCRGTGISTRYSNPVDPRFLREHLANHAYGKLPNGETCGCPRIEKRETGTCVGCGGRGNNHATIAVPKPGQLVKVRNPQILIEIFGEEDAPTDPGKVYRVDGPDDHQLELPNGLAVQVTWDRLTKLNKIPKGSKVDLWAFDLAEIRVVKS